MNTYKVVTTSGTGFDEVYTIEADIYVVGSNGVSFEIRVPEQWPMQVAHFDRPRVIELVKDEPAGTQSPPSMEDGLLHVFATHLAQFDRLLDEVANHQRQVVRALDRWRSAAGIGQDEGGN